jgi:hypothetical protein
MNPNARPYGTNERHAARDSTRHGRNSADRASALTIKRSAVAPSGPMAGNRPLAKDAPMLIDSSEPPSAASAMRSIEGTVLRSAVVTVIGCS